MENLMITRKMMLILGLLMAVPGALIMAEPGNVKTEHSQKNSSKTESNADLAKTCLLTAGWAALAIYLTHEIICGIPVDADFALSAMAIPIPA
jgi:hypothetical protein